jgi:hypothetical protein
MSTSLVTPSGNVAPKRTRPALRHGNHRLIDFGKFQEYLSHEFTKNGAFVPLNEDAVLVGNDPNGSLYAFDNASSGRVLIIECKQADEKPPKEGQYRHLKVMDNVCPSKQRAVLAVLKSPSDPVILESGEVLKNAVWFEPIAYRVWSEKYRMWTLRHESTESIFRKMVDFTHRGSWNFIAEFDERMSALPQTDNAVCFRA